MYNLSITNKRTIKTILTTLLRSTHGLTRSEMVRRTKIPRSTIYDNLMKEPLLSWLVKYDYGLKDRINNRKRHKTVGRPKTYWKINISKSDEIMEFLK